MRMNWKPHTFVYVTLKHAKRNFQQRTDRLCQPSLKRLLSHCPWIKFVTSRKTNEVIGLWFTSNMSSRLQLCDYLWPFISLIALIMIDSDQLQRFHSASELLGILWWDNLCKRGHLHSAMLSLRQYSCDYRSILMIDRSRAQFTADKKTQPARVISQRHSDAIHLPELNFCNSLAISKCRN
jgi:hypothetical protein